MHKQMTSFSGLSTELGQDHLGQLGLGALAHLKHSHQRPGCSNAAAHADCHHLADGQQADQERDQLNPQHLLLALHQERSPAESTL